MPIPGQPLLWCLSFVVSDGVQGLGALSALSARFRTDQRATGTRPRDCVLLVFPGGWTSVPGLLACPSACQFTLDGSVGRVCFVLVGEVMAVTLREGRARTNRSFL